MTITQTQLLNPEYKAALEKIEKLEADIETTDKEIEYLLRKIDELDVLLEGEKNAKSYQREQLERRQDDLRA